MPRAPRVLALSLALAAVLLGGGPAAPRAPATPVQPADRWTCPASHPIKAAVSPRTGQCFYHVPNGPHYAQTRPEFCFASEDEAREQDCTRAEEVL